MAQSPRHQTEQPHSAWLTAAACHDAVATTPDAPSISIECLSRLSRRQRLDLASIAAAAIACSAIILSPLVGTPIERAPIPAYELGIQFAAAQAPRITPPRPARTVAARGLARATFAAPSFTRAEPRTAPVTPEHSASDTGPDTGRGRLSRVLFGSGRYKVQPFPLPAGGTNEN